MLAVLALLLADPVSVYFIDVEGGGAMLVVSPGGESMLVDSGYPDLADRDLNRILRVATEVAGLDRIDSAVVTHWHNDHYGNHAALAANLPIGAFYDRGIPDALQEDEAFEDRIAKYRAASNNDSKTLRAGDQLILKGTAEEPAVIATIVAASRRTIDGGEPNPYAAEHQPRDRDASDNAESLAMVIECGEFRLYCGGDLTWNVEADLVTPNNAIGPVDVYMVTHHGLPSSNNPVLVKAVDPTVAVMCNGPSKGGHPDVLATLRERTENGSLEAWFQLHQNLSVPVASQTNAARIANRDDTASCRGRFIRVQHQPGDDDFTVNVEDRHGETFDVRKR